MKRYLLFALLLLAIAACQTAPEAPPVVVAPEPTADVARDEPIGTVRVAATTLNVRDSASTESAILASVKRGEKLTLLRGDGAWYKVRLSTGVDGWVSSKHVRRVASCPPDSEFRFVEPPMVAFSDSAAHGVVSVEVDVDAKGKILRTKVTGNTTGDETLAFLTEREIRTAKFAPPVRNCKPMRFIYVYRKTF
ncbi:MAG: SH3 domain-containing protein [Thermoanaerobaculia bacterium]